MTKQEKEIIKKEILLAYFKLPQINKTTTRLSVAIQVGLNEAEKNINKKE